MAVLHRPFPGRFFKGRSELAHLTLRRAFDFWFETGTARAFIARLDAGSVSASTAGLLLHLPSAAFNFSRRICHYFVDQAVFAAATGNDGTSAELNLTPFKTKKNRPLWEKLSLI